MASALPQGSKGGRSSRPRAPPPPCLVCVVSPCLAMPHEGLRRPTQPPQPLGAQVGAEGSTMYLGDRTRLAAKDGMVEALHTSPLSLQLRLGALGRGMLPCHRIASRGAPPELERKRALAGNKQRCHAVRLATRQAKLSNAVIGRCQPTWSGRFDRRDAAVDIGALHQSEVTGTRSEATPTTTRPVKRASHHRLAMSIYHNSASRGGSVPLLRRAFQQFPAPLAL